MTIIFPTLVALALAGCGKKEATQVAEQPAATPRWIASSARDGRETSRAERTIHLPEPEKAATPAELGQRLRSGEDAERRGQVVEELWELGTPEAVEILRQQFFIERDTDVKADIVAGVVETKTPETREVRFGILAAALAPTQPVEVRTTAVSMLVEFDDVRAVALLQNLAQDQSEEVREAAKEAIEARREMDAR